MAAANGNSREQSGRLGLHHNIVSYIGGLIMTGGLALEIALFAIRFSTGGGSPYTGILAYLLFPFIILSGLLIFLYGTRRESFRRRKLGAAAGPAYPRIDLNDAGQRRIFQWSLAGLTLAAFFLVAVAYHGFLFTESVTFCGQVCHQVMEPEFTAYQHSPHARVRCVECHVGPGVPWYVKSKLSGVEQVFAVLLATYHRPLRTPIAELRPAREICEECHWPSKFYGAQLRRIPHFQYNEENTAEEIVFLSMVGGTGRDRFGQAGIHWHMAAGVTVEYAAADSSRQSIPWFRVIREDGSTAEYVSMESKNSVAEFRQMERRVMDCMDCHNRPTHIFPAADEAVDQALAAGDLPADLPAIKKQAVAALLGNYASQEAAAAAIRKRLESFYQREHPKVYVARQGEIEAAAGTVSALYRRSVFPFMRVSWSTYPGNNGHRDWPGCFRCHDGRHATAEGRVLGRECTGCHTSPLRSRLSPIGTDILSGSENWHGWELAGRHADLLCHRCHRADWAPVLDCGGCHGLDPQAPMMVSLSCNDCHLQEQQILPLADCSSCHTPAGLHTEESHAGAACTACHPAHNWMIGGRDVCLRCHSAKKDHYFEKGACYNCHSFTRSAAGAE